MNKFNNGHLRTLVRENLCFRDLICLESDKSQICKIVLISDNNLYECLYSNPLCGYKMDFSEFIMICSCPIRQYIAMNIDSCSESQDIKAIEL